MRGRRINALPETSPMDLKHGGRSQFTALKHQLYYQNQSPMENGPSCIGTLIFCPRFKRVVFLSRGSFSSVQGKSLKLCSVSNIVLVEVAKYRDVVRKRARKSDLLCRATAVAIRPDRQTIRRTREDPAQCA